MFAYSLREKTRAARRLEDDVPPEVKKRRLQVRLGRVLFVLLALLLRVVPAPPPPPSIFWR